MTATGRIDCFGIIFYSLNRLGFKIPDIENLSIENARNYYKYFYSVNKDDLHPGDIVGFKPMDSALQGPIHLGMAVNKLKIITILEDSVEIVRLVPNLKKWIKEAYRIKQ